MVVGAASIRGGVGVASIWAVAPVGKCGDADVPPVGGTAAVSADCCGTCCRSTCG